MIEYNGIRFHWEANVNNVDNNSGNYFLNEDHLNFYQYGKPIPHVRCAGWVEKDINGKWRAGVPKDYDPETDSDAEHLGHFDTKEQAMKAVEENIPMEYLWI